MLAHFGHTYNFTALSAPRWNSKVGVRILQGPHCGLVGRTPRKTEASNRKGLAGSALELNIGGQEPSGTQVIIRRALPWSLA